jgi:non-ribosomal peptide synthetase component F
MPLATLRRLRVSLPKTQPFLMYGLTEAFRSTYLSPSELDHRPDSIGKPIPNAEVLVVRPDGTPCAPNEPGELVHRGALVSLGYWNDPVKTAERF